MKQHTLHNNDKIGLLKGNTNSRRIDSFLGRPFFGVLFQSVDFALRTVVPFPGVDASTSFVFVALLNKQQIVDCDRTNNYGRPELFVSDFSARAARFGHQRRRESFVC